MATTDLAPVNHREARFIAVTSLDVLPRAEVTLGWAQGAATETLLSLDDDSGARTTIFDLAPCGAGPTGRFASSVELFVMAGTLEVAGHLLTRYAYCTFPVGIEVGPFRTDGGAKVALFSWGPIEFGPEVEPSRDAISIPLVDPVNCYDLDWQESAENLPNKLPPGLFVKPLMQNFENGSITFLSGSIMRRMRHDRWESHPTFEEQLYLEGEFQQFEVLDTGRRRIEFAGPGYSFRPRDVYHLGAGSGTDTFCLRVVRVPSTLKNVFSEVPNAYPTSHRSPTLYGATGA